jgi:hypothetical protein
MSLFLLSNFFKFNGVNYPDYRFDGLSSEARVNLISHRLNIKKKIILNFF